MSMIKDGTGTSRFAKVNERNRLSTEAITIPIQQQASADNKLYRISIPVVNLTTDGKSAVIYIKNNVPDQDFILPEFQITCGGATGASADALIQAELIVGANAGTIISDENLASLTPANTASTNGVSLDAFVGGEGKTVSATDPDLDYYTIPQSTSILFPSFKTVVPGAAVAISITPPTGTTSLDVSIAIRGYFQARTV